MNTNTNAALLFEHEDGRYAVNPDTTGDPKWHRLGPVDVSTLTTAAQPPAGMVMVPIELAERVRETMGEFLMDHGWRQQDMDTSDDFGALLAAAPKAAKAEPVQQPQWLSSDDLAALERMQECLDDNEGHDVPKERVKRLAELGVIRHHAAGWYSVTSFGRMVLGTAFSRLPLETVDECNERLGREHRQRLGLEPAHKEQP